MVRGLPTLPGLGAGALLMSTAAAPAQDSRYEALTPVVERLVEENRQLGASVLIGDADGVLYRRHFGRFEDNTTVFVASASKWLSAAVIAALVDRGELSLDTTVAEYFPDAPQPLAQATVRQLFAHTSGLPGIHHGLGTRGGTLADSAETALGLKTTGAPGERFSYGGASMQVAGRMAELATGRAWDDLFAETLTGPLGMADTHFGSTDAGSGNPRLGAGARSTLDDYARFLRMLLANGTWDGQRVLSEAMVAEIEKGQTGDARRLGFAPLELRRLPHDIYGLGVWRLSERTPGEIGIVASPGAFGFFPWIDRERGLYGIFMIQQLRRTNPPAWNWGRDVVEKAAEIHDSGAAGDPEN